MNFNLSDIVKASGRSAPEGTVFDLDPELPKVFELDTSADDDLIIITSQVFGQLFDELRKNASGHQCRISTTADGTDQLVYIDHSGSIEDDQLELVNTRFAEIAGGQKWTTTNKSGNRMAAQQLTKINGTVKLLRIEDTQGDTTFKVRTLVTIPAPTLIP